ncbi:MAG: molybdopterin converting factor subunit 1 [Planctomycetota bacterium]
MKITVRCFAQVRELLGQEVLEVDVPVGTTVAGLRELLAADAPDLARLPLAYAVNQDYADGERALTQGDEVAFIPPISGGSGAEEQPEDFGFDLSQEPLDPRALEATVRSDRDGAVVTFAGVTRNHHDGKTVLGLSYECYEEMARKVMDRLFAAAADRFAISRVRVAHRLGEVPVGEASVLVVVAAEHRGPAFEAARWLMDRLKEQVPIFKKEQLAGPDGSQGESRWVGDLPGGSA